jgi:hypothetical protein
MTQLPDTDETFAGTPKNDNIRETKRGREE